MCSREVGKLSLFSKLSGYARKNDNNCLSRILSAVKRVIYSNKKWLLIILYYFWQENVAPLFNCTNSVLVVLATFSLKLKKISFYRLVSIMPAHKYQASYQYFDSKLTALLEYFDFFNCYTCTVSVLYPMDFCLPETDNFTLIILRSDPGHPLILHIILA